MQLLLNELITKIWPICSSGLVHFCNLGDEITGCSTARDTPFNPQLSPVQTPHHCLQRRAANTAVICLPSPFLLLRRFQHRCHPPPDALAGHRGLAFSLSTPLAPKDNNYLMTEPVCPESRQDLVASAPCTVSCSSHTLTVWYSV